MRCDQIMGLNEWASNLVKGEQMLAYTERSVRTYPDGREEVVPPHEVFTSSVIKTPSGKRYEGAYGAEVPLYRYHFPNGRMYEELVQATPWSSGPVAFFALQDENGNRIPESLWSEEAIRDA